VLLLSHSAQVFRDIMGHVKDVIKDVIIRGGEKVSPDDAALNLALTELDDRLADFLRAKMEALEQVRLPGALLVFVFSRRVRSIPCSVPQLCRECGLCSIWPLSSLASLTDDER
jgi:hypothetical protein